MFLDGKGQNRPEEGGNGGAVGGPGPGEDGDGSISAETQSSDTGLRIPEPIFLVAPEQLLKLFPGARGQKFHDLGETSSSLAGCSG